MDNDIRKFVQYNSHCESFLQSEEWRRFQEATGKRTFRIDGISVVEHILPVVGRYFYVPRWPKSEGQVFFKDLTNLAGKNKTKWIRFDVENEEGLAVIRKNVSCKIIKAPHDMQPRETLVIDISKPEEELLAEMKQKTRYNINLAEKKGVNVSCIKYNVSSIKYLDEFIKLVTLTAKRKRIKFHSDDYYRKMVETINSDILSLYVAEYDGKIIAANLVAFCGNTAIYLHGATDDEYRNVMAPYLLQWQAIKDAKNKGFKFYDFGGVKSEIINSKLQIPNSAGDNWHGITKFKLGFSPNTKPVEFLGSWDIIVDPLNYWIYRIIQKLKSLI